MNLFGLSITRAKPAPEQRAIPDDPYWANFAAMRGAGFGAQAAESIATVYACVQAISESVASLPLILYRRTEGGGRDRAPDHPLYEVLHSRPNGWQTALEFREQLQAHVLLRGNAYAQIVSGPDGQVRELLPLHPDRVHVIRLDSGRLLYEVYDQSGRASRLVQEEVLHLKHRADNGILGRSPLDVARDTIRLALNEREHGVASFANGTRLGGVLLTPGRMDPTAQKNLRESFEKEYAGASKSGKNVVLEEGVKFEPLTMHLRDAQWIEAMQLSVEETARIFRVPPTVIGDLRHGNYSNSVEMTRVFVTHTLRRHLAMWEQSISRGLLTERGRRTYFAEHAVEGLLRGDASARANFYQRGIVDGWLLRSEVRQLENMPALPGIDQSPNNATT